MTPNTSDVHLSRVTLRGHTDCLNAARAPLRTALTQTQWPSTAHGELLFLRKISVHGNPREIAARATQQAHQLAHRAVDGWSSSAADAMAVRFRSYASLVACLLRDLLRGTAQHCWYWRSWRSVLQQPLDAAMVSALKTSPLHLPSVIDLLRSTPEWHAFWEHLGDNGAEQVIKQVEQVTGWSRTLEAARTRPESSPSIDAYHSDQPIQPDFDLNFMRRATARSEHDARYLLAALLTVWKTSPALLTKPRGVFQLQQLSRRLCAGAQTIEPPRSVTSPDETTTNSGQLTAKPNVARRASIVPVPEPTRPAPGRRARGAYPQGPPG